MSVTPNKDQTKSEAQSEDTTHNTSRAGRPAPQSDDVKTNLKNERLTHSAEPIGAAQSPELLWQEEQNKPKAAAYDVVSGRRREHIAL